MPAKILVVDDSRTIRVQLRKLLTEAGFEVVLAENGRDAIEKLGCEPDLMVLDVVMPEIDGYGVCERLKEFGDRFERLPIVFLTSVKSQAMILLGREYGAYLQKPVEKDALLEAVNDQLRLISSSRF